MNRQRNNNFLASEEKKGMKWKNGFTVCWVILGWKKLGKLGLKHASDESPDQRALKYIAGEAGNDVE